MSTQVLKKLKEYTSDVKKVVITVPAMFAEKARQATLDAAKIADLEVIELINEPTAAVLHYASLPGVEVGGRVMIFDLGGGTFDVTFAEVKNKNDFMNDLKNKLETINTKKGIPFDLSALYINLKRKNNGKE